MIKGKEGPCLGEGADGERGKNFFVKGDIGIGGREKHSPCGKP